MKPYAISLYIIGFIICFGCTSVEETKWQEALKKRTVIAFQEYNKVYPKGKHVEEAKKEIERLKWKAFEFKESGILNCIFKNNKDKLSIRYFVAFKTQNKLYELLFLPDTGYDVPPIGVPARKIPTFIISRGENDHVIAVPNATYTIEGINLNEVIKSNYNDSEKEELKAIKSFMEVSQYIWQNSNYDKYKANLITLLNNINNSLCNHQKTVNFNLEAIPIDLRSKVMMAIDFGLHYREYKDYDVIITNKIILDTNQTFGNKNIPPSWVTILP